MTIRAVLFDLFETLVTESSAPPPSAASLGPDLGLDGMSDELIGASRGALRRSRPAGSCGAGHASPGDPRPAGALNAVRNLTAPIERL